MQQIKTDEFKALVLDAGQVVVKFEADWCGPCKQMQPKIEQAAKEFDSELVKFVAVNIAQARELAATYNVRAIPTLMVFRDGQVMGSRTGMMRTGEIANFVQEALA